VMLLSGQNYPLGTRKSQTRLCWDQCWGSGSAGSACFWASRIRLRILPFSHKRAERTDKMPAKYYFNTKFKQKIQIFKLKMMWLWASYKKNMKKKIFFCIVNIKRKESDPDPDPLVRGTDPIRTKMLRIYIYSHILLC
jgi:hypothetical protein